MPRKAVFTEAMSPQRFAQEAVLRAQDAILAAALGHGMLEITEEYAELLAKQAEMIGHAVAEQYATPRLPDVD